MVPSLTDSDELVLRAITRRHECHRHKLKLFVLSVETNLGEKTIRRAIKRLTAQELISPTRKCAGVPYDFEVLSRANELKDA